jgi:hypothetical protein
VRRFSQASGAPGSAVFVNVGAANGLLQRSRIRNSRTPRTNKKNIETLRHVRVGSEKIAGLGSEGLSPAKADLDKLSVLMIK